jgi:hypothetical protein
MLGPLSNLAVQLQADEDEWRAIKRTSQAHTYAEALEVQERGERNARHGNIAFDASAGWPRSPSGSSCATSCVAGATIRTPAVGATPLPGGAAATVRISF